MLKSEIMTITAIFAAMFLVLDAGIDSKPLRGLAIGSIGVTIAVGLFPIIDEDDL